jgi:hypothetical protein
MSQQDLDNQNYLNEEEADEFSFSPAMIGWGVAALALAIFSVTFNTSALALGAGWFAKCVAVLVGSLLGWGGALIGDAIRRFAHPDAVFTNGGILSLIWIKVFWALGPQLIGLFIGVFTGAAIVLK